MGPPLASLHRIAQRRHFLLLSLETFFIQMSKQPAVILPAVNWQTIKCLRDENDFVRFAEESNMR